jgi:hypothetical protein
MPAKQPDVISVPWVRSPRQLDFFAKWSPGEVKLWTAINSATQINTRNGRISVPALARFTGYSERTVYRILRRLKDRGAIYSLHTPGHTSFYYLPHHYSSPHTHDNRVTAHNNKEVIDKNNSPRTSPYIRYRPYLPPAVTPHLTAKCYQSYTEYCATTNRPVSIDTWASQ